MAPGLALRALRAAAPKSGPARPSLRSAAAAAAAAAATTGQRRSVHTSPPRRSEALGAAAAGLPDAEPAPPGRPGRSVTIRDLEERRARSGRLVAGAAAPSSSAAFKAPPAPGRPRARRWDHHLSAESLARQPCVLKEAARYLDKPGLISLGGGLPCAENFPIESLTVRVPSPGGGGGGDDPFTEEATRARGRDARVGKYDAAPGGGGGEYDLSIALNYGQAAGSAQLLRWVTEHTELVCDPPYADWAACLTVGSTGALEQALRMLCDRARGDALLTEEYSFSTALETAAPLGVPVFGVPMDGEGLLPGRLDEMLRGWEPAARGGARRPHVLYTVPSGQNPTGATQGARRRREVYEVCRRHDVFILEDEPYYFLQMPPYRAPGPGARHPPPAPPAPSGSVDEFLDSLVPSLLSIDTDGRVLRMDSFSKVVVPGSRLGWITASEQVVERFLRHAEVCNQGPSGLSQAVLWRLLDREWGHEGYLRWLMHLRGEYTRRRDVLLTACDEFLPREVVSWDPPAAGMFHWLRVDHARHPDAARRSILEIEEEIFDSCIDKGVLVARGSWFRAEQDKPPAGLFFRATFAAAAADKMTEAIRRFGEAVRQSYRLA